MYNCEIISSVQPFFYNSIFVSKLSIPCHLSLSNFPSKHNVPMFDARRNINKTYRSIAHNILADSINVTFYSDIRIERFETEERRSNSSFFFFFHIWKSEQIKNKSICLEFYDTCLDTSSYNVEIFKHRIYNNSIEYLSLRVFVRYIFIFRFLDSNKKKKKK